MIAKDFSPDQVGRLVLAVCEKSARILVCELRAQNSPDAERVRRRLARPDGMSQLFKLIDFLHSVDRNKLDGSGVQPGGAGE